LEVEMALDSPGLLRATVQGGEFRLLDIGREPFDRAPLSYPRFFACTNVSFFLLVYLFLKCTRLWIGARAGNVIHAPIDLSCRTAVFHARLQGCWFPSLSISQVACCTQVPLPLSPPFSVLYRRDVKMSNPLEHPMATLPPVNKHFPPLPQFSGFMKPCRYEGEIQNLEVYGVVPPEINGTFYRVMPDPAFPGFVEDDPVCPSATFC
jgi:hypothetical protein